MNKEIDKPWVVYGCFKNHIGKIIDKKDSSISILYGSSQNYPAETWVISSPREFRSIVGAAGYLVRNKIKTPMEIYQEVKIDFPEESKGLEKFIEAFNKK